MDTDCLLTKCINLSKHLPIDQNVYTYWINDNLVTSTIMSDYIEYTLSGVFGVIEYSNVTEHQDHLKHIYRIQLDRLGIKHDYHWY